MVATGIILHIIAAVLWSFALSRIFRPLVFGAIRLPGEIAFDEFYMASMVAAGLIVWAVPGTVWEWSSFFIFNWSRTIEGFFVAAAISTFLHTLVGPFVMIGIGLSISTAYAVERGWLEPSRMGVVAGKAFGAVFLCAVAMQLLSGLMGGTLKLAGLLNPTTRLYLLVAALIDAVLGCASMHSLGIVLFHRIQQSWHLRA